MFLIDDAVAGAIKYAIKKDSSLSARIRLQCRNTMRIWQGLFMGSLGQILSRFTWEIIQTLVGFLTAHTANLIREVHKVEFFHGTTVLEGAGVRGSICLGTYILLYPGYETDGEVCRHEFGHTIQSRISGPLYFLKYGISSILLTHASWVEADANLRAAQFFGVDSEFAKPGKWKVATQAVNPRWWEYALFFLGAGIVLIPFLNYREGV